MSNPSLNPHISISSPFSVADLPTLCVWRNRLHRLNGEPEESLQEFMDEHLSREFVRTFAAYRDGELGGALEAVEGDLIFQDSTADVCRVEMVFKREFFKARSENGNGQMVGGQDVTKPALNMVLRELFDEFELVFFPLAKINRPIQSLVASVGAANVGLVDDGVNLFVLSRAQWQSVNAGFIAEWEAAHPKGLDEINELLAEEALFEAEPPVFARIAEDGE